eukprot:UN19792
MNAFDECVHNLEDDIPTECPSYCDYSFNVWFYILGALLYGPSVLFGVWVGIQWGNDDQYLDDKRKGEGENSFWDSSILISC